MSESLAPWEDSGLDGMIDLEIQLVSAFGWSLRDIDETDVESLLPFIFRLTKSKTGGGMRVYADQANWL